MSTSTKKNTTTKVIGKVKGPTPESPQGWFRRHWHMLLIVLPVVILLAVGEFLPKQMGTMIFIPALIAISVVCALGLRRLVNRDTTDADASTGAQAQRWQWVCQNNPGLACTLYVVQFLVYFAVCGLIAAACMH